jgi:hypothetical protein
MAKIKWKSKADIEAEKAKQEKVKAEKEKYKGKKFTTLSTKEKDELLELLAKEHGLI